MLTEASEKQGWSLTVGLKKRIQCGNSDLVWTSFRPGIETQGFFQSKASSWFQKNLIEGVFNSIEVWRGDGKEIEGVFVDYYSDLFFSSSPTDFAEIVNAVQPKVTEDMTTRLIKEFQAYEVFKVLK